MMRTKYQMVKDPRHHGLAGGGFWDTWGQGAIGGRDWPRGLAVDGQHGELPEGQLSLRLAPLLLLTAGTRATASRSLCLRRCGGSRRAVLVYDVCRSVQDMV